VEWSVGVAGARTVEPEIAAAVFREVPRLAAFYDCPVPTEAIRQSGTFVSASAQVQFG
jgi:hypothetical protein